jgi:hypothetical protein
LACLAAGRARPGFSLASIAFSSPIPQDDVILRSTATPVRSSGANGPVFAGRTAMDLVFRRERRFHCDNEMLRFACPERSRGVQHDRSTTICHSEPIFGEESPRSSPQDLLAGVNSHAPHWGEHFQSATHFWSALLLIHLSPTISLPFRVYHRHIRSKAWPATSSKQGRPSRCFPSS